MKYLVKIFVIIFTLFYINNATADSSIVYINIEKLLNQTLAGKSINEQFKNIQKKNYEEFAKIENELKNEEEKIVTQKNIISEEEFSNKINEFRNSVNNYRKQRKEKIDILNNKKINASKELLNQVNPILSDYSEKNNILIILPKKSVVLAKTDLDITNDIIKITDKKVKKINFK